MLKLYYFPGTVAVAPALGLEEAGLDYEPVLVDFKAAAQREGTYLAINPKGRVPTLITECGATLTEAGAILDYIAALAPDAGLVPEDAEDAAHMRGVMYYLASTMHVAHAHKMRGSRWADAQSSFDDMSAKVPQTMRDCATYIEENALRGDFVTGDRISLADPYLFTVCQWLAGDGVPTADFPKVDAFLERMEARDSVKAIRAKGIL